MNWNNYRHDQKAYIKQQVRNDFFAWRRLHNFLDQFSPEVMNTKIHNDDDNSYTFQEMLDDLEREIFTVEVPE